LICYIYNSLYSREWQKTIYYLLEIDVSYFILIKYSFPFSFKICDNNFYSSGLTLSSLLKNSIKTSAHSSIFLISSSLNAFSTSLLSFKSVLHRQHIVRFGALSSPHFGQTINFSFLSFSIVFNAIDLCQKRFFNILQA